MANELSGVPGMRSVPLPPGAAVRPVEPSRALVPPLEAIETTSAGQDVPLGRSGVSALDVLLTSDLVVEREAVAPTALEMGLEQARGALLRQQPGEALEALDAVWSRAAQSEEGWYLRAGALVLLGQPAESDRVAGEGLERAPQSVALRFLQSVARALGGDLTGARAALLGTLDTAPGHPVLVAQQVILQARQGRSGETGPLLERLSLAFPDHPATAWAQREVRTIRADLTRAASRASSFRDWPTAGGPSAGPTASLEVAEVVVPEDARGSRVATPATGAPRTTPPNGGSVRDTAAAAGSRSATPSGPSSTAPAPAPATTGTDASATEAPTKPHWFEPAPPPVRPRTVATDDGRDRTAHASASATSSASASATSNASSNAASSASPNAASAGAPHTARDGAADVRAATAGTPDGDALGDATGEAAFSRLGVRLSVAGTSDALEATRGVLRNFSSGGTLASGVLPDQAHAARTVLAAVVSALRNEPTTAGASPVALVMRQIVSALRDGRASELPRMVARDARMVPWPQRRWIEAMLREVAPVAIGVGDGPRSARVATPTSGASAASMDPSSVAGASRRTPADTPTVAHFDTLLHDLRPDGPEVPIRLGLGLLADSAAARQAALVDAAALETTGAVVTPPDGRVIAAMTGVQYTPGPAAPLDLGTVLPPILALTVALAAGLNGATTVALVALGATVWLAVRRRTISVTPAPTRRAAVPPGATVEVAEPDGATGID